MVLFRRVRSSLCKGLSVTENWISALPREKSQLFSNTVRLWESSYAMMSVALDEAFSLRARGELVCARQQVSVSAQLLGRLAGILIRACSAMSDTGRHISNLPAVEPLNSDFFRSDTAQSAASWNGLLHHVVLGERHRFFHKLRTLSETVDRLTREFFNASGEIAEGMCIQPGSCWKTLDSLHYDLNTCLRESEVMFKCFLRSLPPDQLPPFAGLLESHAPLIPTRVRRFSRAATV
jgi:hypothetical protein